jgi:hypothetical protein
MNIFIWRNAESSFHSLIILADDGTEYSVNKLEGIYRENMALL